MKRLSTLFLLLCLITGLPALALGPNAAKLKTLKLGNLQSELPVPQAADEQAAPRFSSFAHPNKSPQKAIAYSGGAAVMTYKTLATALSMDGGNGVTITKNASSNFYVIHDFFDKDIDLSIRIDLESGNVTVPSQKVITIDGNDVYFAFCTSTGPADYNAHVTGSIDADGTIHFDSWWGLYVKGGEYDGTPLGYFYSTDFTPANATMTETFADGSTPLSYPVRITQQANVLSVSNFANHGYPVEVVLNSDKTGQIDRQTAYMSVDEGNIYVSGYADSDVEGTINLVNPIQLNKATDLRNISWGNWTLYSSNGYYNLWSAGQLACDFDLTYPIEVTSLEGSGSEQDPYLINTIYDLDYLGKLCREDQTAGKFFAINSDIDMSNYRFVPMGSMEHPFEGVIDGRDHTLTNLDVDSKSQHSGLFGYASSTSVIKNIKLFKPYVSSTGRYTAGLVGYTEGDIDNCHIDQATIGSNYSFVAGIAGVARNVNNSSISLSQIVGLNGNVAGIASVLTGEMTNCAVEDVFIYTGATSRTASGGLVANAQENSRIADSHFAGLLSGSPSGQVGQIQGGIVGEGYKMTIERCFSAAQIDGYTIDAIVGGIAGHLAGKIIDSFSAGTVSASASAYTGGLVGYLDPQLASELTNCYTSAVVSANVSVYNVETDCSELVGNYAQANATYTNLWFDSQMTSYIGSKQNAKTTAELTAYTGIPGFSRDVWTFTAQLYPRLKGQISSKASDLACTAIQFSATENLELINANTRICTAGSTFPFFIMTDASGNAQYSAKGNGAEITIVTDNEFNLRLNGTFATDQLTLINGNAQFITYTVKFVPAAFEGDGSEANPYLIKTKDDILKLAEVSSLKGQPFNGAHFKMTADIDMAGVEDFQGIGNVAWSKGVSFGGIFDGDGHSIHNLKLGGIVWTTKPANEDISWEKGVPTTTGQPAFRALFGSINGKGAVKNLTIASDCSIDGGSYVAAFCVMNSGRIENCRNFARVRSIQTYAAGIAVSNSGVITNCLNAGEIMVNGSYAAGIACYNYGTISKVMNVANISAKTLAKTAYDSNLGYAGGIVSYANGEGISDAVNAGTIYSEKSQCGGIAAYNPKYGNGVDYNKLENVINYGMVEGATPSMSGAIVGDGSTAGTVKNTYWDSQIITLMPNANTEHAGMEGKETSWLTSGTTPEGFDPAVWTFAAGNYPALANFASEGVVKAATNTVLTLAPGETVRNINTNATLSSAKSLGWSLTKSAPFSISGNTLNVEVSKSFESDVLTATNGIYVKKITIATCPEIQLEGNGTERSPYRLTSVADWNTLAKYVRDTKNDMMGVFIKVMNDIDFTGETFNPIAVGGDIFNGHILGNGKKLANITHSFALIKDANGKDIKNSAGKQGAFGILGAYGSIQDLTISGSFTQNADNYGAVFVGQCYGKVQNCVNEATMNGSRAYRAGFAALSYEGAQFIDCVNKGTITGTGTVGNAAGIVSVAQGPTTFIRCGNEGIIYGPGTNSACICGSAVPSTFIECYNIADQENPVSFFAGILAQANSLAGYTFTFDGCYNTGNLKTKGNVAGIIATASYSNCPMNITGCYNTGDITAATIGSNNCSGGAAGLFHGLGPNSVVTDCWNSGKVSILDNNQSNAGGIARDVKNNTIIRNCRNTGDVYASGSLVAGIAVQPATNVVIENCENTGNVSNGRNGCGGIVANSFSDFTIRNCRNLGNISCGSSNGGGILGTSQGAKVIIEDCVNFGNVTTKSVIAPATMKAGDTGSTTEGYAIGGIAGATGGTITRCYNVGNVSAPMAAGGIVGLPYTSGDATKANLTIVDSYNMGEVTSSVENSCGAVIGVAGEASDAATTGKYWSDLININNDVHYLNGVCNSTAVAVGEPISIADLASLDRGEGWTSADDYSFPVLLAHADHYLASLHSAAVVLDADDTFDNVTTDFKVGTPQNVFWSASIDDFEFEGNDVTVPVTGQPTPVTLTATCGDYSKSYKIVLNSTTSVDELNAAGETIDMKYFDLNGFAVNAENLQTGVTYIIVATYANGSVKIAKIIR